MANACTDSIVNLIAELGLAAGDRLPGERELARRLGFSRTTVRESLVALAALGRVEVRGRSGCYIGTRAEADSGALQADPAAALDALRALGPHLAARAAQRCTPEAARRLEAVTARLGRFLINRDSASSAREYLTFFVVLADVVGNPYLALLARTIAEVRHPAARPTMERSAVESFFALHVSLLQALQARDSRHAVALAAHGLDTFTMMMGNGELREAVA